jgi:SNF2 family DNA or RNA helicase
VSGKLGILADSPGSGKTLTTLGYMGLLKNAALQTEIEQALGLPSQHPFAVRGDLNAHSNRIFSSHQIVRHMDSSSTHVIIVPPHLLDHWTSQIATHTTFQPFVIDKPRILRNRTTLDGILNSPFVLITSRMYREFYEWSGNNSLRWNHVFIDEATSIVLPGDRTPQQFQFLWLITNEWIHFMFRNQYIYPHNLQHIRDRFQLHPDSNTWLSNFYKNEVQLFTTVESGPFFKSLVPWTHPCRYALVLRNKNTIHYPPTYEVSYECAASYTLANLPQTIIGNQYAGLTHEKMPALFKALGLSTYTRDQILAHYPSRKEQMDGCWDNDCCICLEPIQVKTLVGCCMNMFCGACILRQILTQVQSPCPTCRQTLYLPSLLPIADASGILSPSLLTKQEQVITYLQNRKEESHIIYSPFENTYYQIFMELQKIGLTSERLDGRLHQNNQIFDRFQKGLTKVLFVSNTESIRGMNLTKASSLLFFSDPPSYERQQMLLHSAQRIGAPKPLILVRLRQVL